MADLTQRDLPEWAAWHEAQERVQAVKARLAELEHCIPDADEKQRSKLLAEQHELALESQMLPGTVAEAARRYVLAHLTYFENEYIRLDANFVQVDAVWQEICNRGHALRKREDALGQIDTSRGRLNAPRLSAEDAATFEASLQQRIETKAAQAQVLSKERGALETEAKPVEQQWYRVKLNRNAQVDRARALYGVRFLLNHSDWARCAHVFGEMQRGWAQGELFGHFDSLAGPVGLRARGARRNVLPAP